MLEVYFRQCAMLVTARDIAVMAATLANRGVNPVTGEQVMTPYAISRTLSVMTSSGMYDYAGEWIYRVGIPAKSGVGGGILAALPARLGLGSYSPKLDSHGNSVRGIKVCEALSSHYDLHMLNRSDDARNSIIADYDIGKNPSRRSRRPHERNILAAHHQRCPRHRAGGHAVVFQRRLRVAPARRQAAPAIRHLRPAPGDLDDPRRRPPGRRGIPRTGGPRRHRDPVRHQAGFAGVERSSANGPASSRTCATSICSMPRSNGPKTRWSIATAARSTFIETTELSEQPLLAGLTRGGTDRSGFDRVDQDLPAGRKDRHRRRARDLAVLPAQRRRARHPARRHPARDADRGHGRSAKWRCWKPTAPPTCWPTCPPPPTKSRLRDFERFRKQHPRASERIMRNLAQLLADRLIVANTRVDLLTAN